MKYLVTGAAGFIGYHVSRDLLDAGHEVVGLDSVNDYYRTDLKEARLALLASHPCARAFEFHRADLADRGAVSRAFDSGPFDRVIHLAAQAGVRYSIEKPFAYAASNLDGFLSILEACRERKVPHLAFASSSSVYGMNRKVPFSETDGTDHPVSLYAATKKANEAMAHSYSALYGLPCTGMRFFTVYGPLGRPDMAYFKFADAIMRGKEIDVYNGGDLLRDFTYVDDVAKAVVMIADRPAAPHPLFDPESPLPDRSSAPYRIYNIGNENPVPLMEFIGTLESALGAEAKKRFLPMQPGDVYMTAADTGALWRDFGWKPSTPLSTGLARFAAWYKETKQWQ